MRISDWSSDVCSSDLAATLRASAATGRGKSAWVTLLNWMTLKRSSAFRRFRAAITAALAWSRESPCIEPEVSMMKTSSRGSGRASDAGTDADGGTIMTSRSEEHTSELQSLMRISYAVFCLTKTKQK